MLKTTGEVILSAIWFDDDDDDDDDVTCLRKEVRRAYRWHGSLLTNFHILLISQFESGNSFLMVKVNKLWLTN